MPQSIAIAAEFDNSKSSRPEGACGERQTLFCFSREMANAMHMPRPHLILGLSLPLAVLPRCSPAEPAERASLAAVVPVTALRPGVRPDPARSFAL